MRAKRYPLEPGRNEQCLCGSGRKFKKCCAALYRLPAYGRLQAALGLSSRFGRPLRIARQRPDRRARDGGRSGTSQMLVSSVCDDSGVSGAARQLLGSGSLRKPSRGCQKGPPAHGWTWPTSLGGGRGCNTSTLERTSRRRPNSYSGSPIRLPMSSDGASASCHVLRFCPAARSAEKRSVETPVRARVNKTCATSQVRGCDA